MVVDLEDWKDLDTVTEEKLRKEVNQRRNVCLKETTRYSS